MAKEIERKFLVTDESYKSMATEIRTMMQAYLSTRPEATVRVRIADGCGFLTVKSKNRGAERDEWEYPVPAADAEAMARLAPSTVIEKRRHIVPYGGLTWEVDEFTGRHAGLTVAEVELPSADVVVELPPFVGREVTGDAAYYNSNLTGGQGL